MSATADSIIERRRLRKRLAFWRILAILAILAAVLALIPWGKRDRSAPHVARITIEGVITDDAERLEAIARVRDAEDARALIVQIASPGGTVVGSEALYEALRAVAEKKPVVAVVGELAASGGYIAALGSDRIVARRNAITGSIGVISQVPNLTGLMEAIGVSVIEVKSDPLKAAPSPLSDPSPEALAALEALILDSYGWFVDLVAERRGLAGERLDAVTDGRVFTGHQALALGLVDAIGGEEAARAWLTEAHDIGTDLAVRDYRWGEPRLPFPFDRFEDAAAAWLPDTPLRLGPGPRLLALFTG